MSEAFSIEEARKRGGLRLVFLERYLAGGVA